MSFRALIRVTHQCLQLCHYTAVQEEMLGARVVRHFLIRQFPSVTLSQQTFSQRHILSRLFLNRQFLIRQFLTPTHSHKTVSQRTISHQLFSHTKHSCNIRRLYYPTFSHLSGPMGLTFVFPGFTFSKRHFLSLVDKKRHFLTLVDKKKTFSYFS